MPRRQLFVDMQRDRSLEDPSYNNEQGDLYNCSNFVDLDWLSSSGNSCEEEPYDRYSFNGCDDCMKGFVWLSHHG